VYLSCAEIATPAAKTAIDTEILRLISVFFFIVASPNPVVGNCVVALFSPRLRAALPVAHEEHDYSMDLRVAEWGPMPWCIAAFPNCRRCPLWVKRVILTVLWLLPVFRD
jgi:hypothetical protein